ncbi:MAG: Na+/H+ antiporter NhaA [Pseudomonadota bacterium]
MSRFVVPPPPSFVMTAKLRAFLRLEASAGIILFLAAVLAVIIANTPFAGLYHATLKPLLLLINDGLMAVFFFLVGLEIKREFKTGNLASRSHAMLPAIAAVGGMVLPMLIYLAVNINHPENWRGWAIPAATDIAFALGVLSLLGSRVPISVKVFLTAIAVMDDLGAIVIIALFYTADLNIAALLMAGLACVGLLSLRARRVMAPAAYVLVGCVLWAALLKSGVHPTIGGVLTALAIPGKSGGRLEHRLHPWVAYGILPIFAFANAGVSLAGIGLVDFVAPLTLGITLGLVIGKMVGVFAFAQMAIWLRWCAPLAGVNWRHILGVAMLCGIGFTMSLFIGELAVGGEDGHKAIRLGVIAGSLISAVLGYAVLRRATK